MKAYLNSAKINLGPGIRNVILDFEVLILVLPTTQTSLTILLLSNFSILASGVSDNLLTARQFVTRSIVICGAAI